MLRAGKTEKLPFKPSVFQLTFAYSCLFLVLLQLWRPYYFLNDDTLILWLPIVTTMGDRLVHGQTPTFDPYLFGGTNLLNDPSFISLWNPLVFALALVGKTRFYLATIDIFCSVNLLLTSLSFTLLLKKLRELKSLPLSDRRLVFLSLSFTFSAYALSVGACWLMFLANPVCLCWMTLGLFTQERGPAIRTIAAGLVFGILVGHMSPLLFSLLFLTLFAFGVCWADRSWQPLQRWGLGILLAMVLVSPIVFPAARGFLSSPRSTPFSLNTLSENNVPLVALISSYFFGCFGVFAGGDLGLFSKFSIYGVSSCAASFLFFTGLPQWKKLSRLEIALIVVAAITTLFIVRPHWLAVVVSHLPLFRSLRWPFREVFILLFFVHLWLALRPVTMAPRMARMYAAIGVVIFLASYLTAGAWNFSPMKIDRQLLISGQAQAYWDKLRSEFGPHDKLLTIIDPHFKLRHHEIPYTLLGAYDYPSLFKVHSISGYTAPGFESPGDPADAPLEGGAYSSKVGLRLVKRDPHLKALRLVSLDPPRIDLCSSQGCQTLDLPKYKVGK